MIRDRIQVTSAKEIVSNHTQTQTSTQIKKRKQSEKKESENKRNHKTALPAALAITDPVKC
jgi:hypothetical protein